MLSGVVGWGLTGVGFAVGVGGDGVGSLDSTLCGFPTLMPGGFAVPEVLTVMEVIFAIQAAPFASGTINRIPSESGCPFLSYAMIR